MIHIENRNQCCGCSACADACPHRAIKMVPDGMGFLYPAVDKDLCVDCGICDRVCAFHPLEEPVQKAIAIRFPEYLDQSQSGGLGYALMRKAVKQGMVVYGAAMDPDLVVRHVRVTTEEGLEPLRLTKYVQSDMTGVPGQVLADLKAGRKVLFTGTPCQCAGVGSLAGTHRKDLLLADIVCHGVPAPYVWRDYLKYVEQREGEPLTGALFRDPSLGWHGAREKLCFASKSLVTNDYAHLYFRRYMMRPSCLACPFASLARPSDLTMADCWGVEKALPGFADDNRGCSLLLVSTEAGRAFAAHFDEDPQVQEVDIQAVLQARALVEVLRSLGHDAHVIDYAPAYLTRPFRLWRKDWWKHPVGTAKNLANSFAVARRKRGFRAFREGMHLMPFPPEGLDAVVFGSDQIWNHILNGEESVWFAQDPAFDHTRNISYAASTGSVPLPEGVDFSRFYRLSVREPQLQAELAARGVASTLVLDPVLLAGKEVLETMASPCPVKGRYVVAYEVIDNPQVLQIATRFGLPVVRIASNPCFAGSKRFVPGEFISLIRGAEHVVASSFHGIAVAKIYGVDFVYPPSGTPKDDRILHLFASDTDLDALRAQSLTFLQESLA